MFSFGGKPRPPTLNTSATATTVPATDDTNTLSSATSERPLSFASTRTTASSFRNSIFSALTRDRDRDTATTTTSSTHHTHNHSNSIHNPHSSFAASTAPPSLYSLGSRGSSGSGGSETSSLHRYSLSIQRPGYHPTQDDPIFMHKARFARARALKAQKTRLMQAQFVVEVLTFLGHGAVLGGSCATVLHGVDVVLGRGMEHNSPEKRMKRDSRTLSGGGQSVNGSLLGMLGAGDELGAMAALAAEDVTVPNDVDVVIQLRPEEMVDNKEQEQGQEKSKQARESQWKGKTLWEITDEVAREIVEKFPQWFYIEYIHPPAPAEEAPQPQPQQQQQQQQEQVIMVMGDGVPQPLTLIPASELAPSSTESTTTAPPPQQQQQQQAAAPSTPPPPPELRLVFHDPDNLLTTNLNLFTMMYNSGSTTSSSYSFRDMIEFAYHHPPPPPPPRSSSLDEPEPPLTPTTPRPASSSSSLYGGGSGEEPSLRNPIQVKLHITGPRAQWSWLTHITLLQATPTSPQSIHKAIITHPFSSLDHHNSSTCTNPASTSSSPPTSASASSIPLNIPLLALPTLLVSKLCSANHRLRSIVMTDKKKGHLDLRQSVAISRHMRVLNVRLPREWMPPPPEAVRVLQRLRGNKGREEKELLLWVLRVGAGSGNAGGGEFGGNGMGGGSGQKGGQNGGPGGGYVPGGNRQLRELALVRRSTTQDFSSSGMTSPVSPRSPGLGGFRTVSLHAGGYFSPRVEEKKWEDAVEGEKEKEKVVVEPVSSTAVVSPEVAAAEKNDEPIPPPPPPPPAPVSRSASVRWSFKGWGGGGAASGGKA